MKVNLLRQIYWSGRGLLFHGFSFFIKKREGPPPESFSKILIIALFRIGDAVCATPVFRELKRHNHDVRIDLVCSPYNADVFRINPHIQNLFEFSFGDLTFPSFIRALRKNNYDLALDLTSDDKVIGALLARLSGAKFCMGYDVQARAFCLDLGLPIPYGPLHATKIFGELLNSIHVPMISYEPEMFLAKKEKEDVKELLALHGIHGEDVILGIHPGANFPSQRLSPEKWAALASAIHGAFPVKTIVFGGPKDKKNVKAIFSIARKGSIEKIKPSDLRQTMALINRCNILACNNSGPLHIAVALRIPTISWMGPTVPYRWAPMGSIHRVIRKKPQCSPCNKGNCSDHACEKAISVNDLLAEFEALYSFFKTR